METHGLPLYLNESQRKEIINYYRNELKNAEARVKELKDLISTLSAPQQQLSLITQAKDEAVFAGYNKSWPWPRKIQFALETIKRCQSTREIVDFIKNCEPGLDDSKTISSVSGTISNRIKDGKQFDRYAEYDGGEWYIGLEEWFSTKNQVKTEYRH